MSPRPTRSPAAPWIAAARTAVTAAFLGIAASCGPAAVSEPGSHDVGHSAQPRTRTPSDGPPSVADPRSVAVPSRGIAAELDPLRLARAGILVSPEYGRAGWYADGPEPGELGAAVIAGHVDSATGPDVFAALPDLAPDDRIVVGLEDGTTLHFRVTRVRLYPQRHFPTNLVYATTQRPELRLITCGGAYDHTAGRYLDNLVVFATLAGAPTEHHVEGDPTGNDSSAAGKVVTAPGRDEEGVRRDESSLIDAS